MRIGNPIGGGRAVVALGVTKCRTEFEREDLRDKRTAGERPAHSVDPVGPEPAAEFGDAGLERRRIGKQAVESEPRVTVVARLVAKVSRACGNQPIEITDGPSRHDYGRLGSSGLVARGKS